MTATLSPSPTSALADLSRRADPALLPELMDGPCTYDQFRDCVRDIAATSRLTLAYGPTRRFVGRMLRKHGSATPLQVVDVGSGGGDTLRHLARWTHRGKQAARLIAIDINPYATAAARELTPQQQPFEGLEWITGDVFTHPRTQHPDVVICSLVTHHMQDEEIVRFLKWMEAHASQGWFISDLARSPVSLRFFKLLARMMRWHPFVQHDGPVSIRRAFREDDWRRLLRAAGIAPESVALERLSPGRLCLTRVR